MLPSTCSSRSRWTLTRLLDSSSHCGPSVSLRPQFSRRAAVPSCMSGRGSTPPGLLDVLTQHCGVNRCVLAPATRSLAGPAVVEHLLRVTAGLESRVVGEVDVQRQVRSAYRVACDAGTAGPLLGRLFPLALRCGSEVRAHTILGDRGRSLARQAVDVGLRTLGGSKDPEALVVGSGQMATVAARHLAALGLRYRVAARDEHHAARLGGAERVCPLASLVDGIGRADLLICATSAAHHVVTVDHVREAMATRRHPL